jgi:catechol 2,3-dioxygenase-like lactoylglutathione lyase family enzyme
MIAGAHGIIFCEEPERARAFFRDVLGFESVDAGAGWLIFKLPPAELAMHGDAAEGGPEGRHEIFLMCHDLDETVAELTARGVEFATGVSVQRWGRIARFKIPGAGEIGLYEPAHPSPLPGFQDQGPTS